MLEINRQSNDRVHCCMRERKQCTCRTSTVSPSTHRRHPGEDIHEVPLGVTHCGGSHARTLFNSALVYVAEVRIHSTIMRPRVLHALHCVYRDLAMSRSFVVVFFFSSSLFREFVFFGCAFVFPSDFRNKYDFFVTVGSSGWPIMVRDFPVDRCSVEQV